MRHRQGLYLLLAAGAVVMLAGFAYFATAPNPADGGPDPITTVARWMNDHGFPDLSFTQAELLANLVVFIPVSLAAFFLFPARLRLWAMAVGPALSAAIEVTQFVFFPERTATLTDFLANTVGSFAGIGIAWFIQASRQASRQATRLRESAEIAD